MGVMASVDYGALTPVEGSVGDLFGDKDVDGGSEVLSASFALTDLWSMVRSLQQNAQMLQRLIFNMWLELPGILRHQNMLSLFGTLVS